jgi:hypothetical protein
MKKKEYNEKYVIYTLYHHKYFFLSQTSIYGNFWLLSRDRKNKMVRTNTYVIEETETKI